MNPKYSRYYTFVKPIFQNSTVKTYNSFALSLIIITIFSLFAIKPTLKTIATLQKQIEQQTKVLDQLNAKARTVSQAKSNLDSMSDADKAKLEALLPSQTDPVGLAKNMVQWANQYTASISAMELQNAPLVGEPQTGSSSADLAELPFTFNISGSYPNMVSTLSAFNSSSRLLYLNTILMSQESDQGITVAIDGKTYFLK